jgi:hypothetical protein
MLLLQLPSVNGGPAANMGDPAIDKGGPSNRTRYFSMLILFIKITRNPII